MSALQLARDALKPCPFCGSTPGQQPWHGGSPTKVMISCDNEDCEVSPMVTGETPQEAVGHWNRRAAIEAEAVQVEPAGYWQGQYSKDGGATLYEVPQASVFGLSYRNIPLFTTPQPAHEWMPIETMPKDDGSYLVANAAIGMVAPHIQGVIHNNTGTAHDWQYGEAITHWMPMPAAPRRKL